VAYKIFSLTLLVAAFAFALGIIWENGGEELFNALQSSINSSWVLLPKILNYLESLLAWMGGKAYPLLIGLLATALVIALVIIFRKSKRKSIGSEMYPDEAMARLNSEYLGKAVEAHNENVRALEQRNRERQVRVGLIESRQQKKVYFERNRLQLYQIAYLSLGMEPIHADKLPPIVIDRHRQLKEAIEDGDLRADSWAEAQNPNLMTRVSLSDFKKFSYESNNPDFMDLSASWGSYQESPSRYDVWLGDAIFYISFGTWKDEAKKLTSDLVAKIHYGMREFRQKACDGDIEIWGSENFSGIPLLPIPKEYWRKFSVSEFEVAKNRPAELTSALADGNWDGDSVKRHLRTSVSIVHKLWPLERN
jgi:hypothetical protein